MKISKANYRLLFRLYGTQNWLISRENKLLQTLDLCETIEEQNLLIDLLHRFVYINGSQLTEHLRGIADLICCEWNLDKTKVQLVATTADYEPDSAQLMLQVMKPLLPERGWGSVKLNNNFTRSFKYLAEYPVVVLIDEFSGTGRTLLSRIKSLKSEAEQREKSSGKKIDLEIYVSLMASIEDVRPIVSANCAKFEAQIWLKKGISGQFIGHELETAVGDMNRLETTLKQDLPSIQFPSFGDGRQRPFILWKTRTHQTPFSQYFGGVI